MATVESVDEAKVESLDEAKVESLDEAKVESLRWSPCIGIHGLTHPDLLIQTKA